jgi:hypothetical protein
MNYKIGELTSQRAGFEPTIMGRQCVNIVDRLLDFQIILSGESSNRKQKHLVSGHINQQNWIPAQRD